MIKKFLLLFSLSILLFNACTEKISDAGDMLIPPADEFNIVKFNSDSNSIVFSATSYEQKIDLGASPRVLLGKFEDIKSTALLKFFIFLPDTLKDPLTNNQVNIIDSWVEIPLNYQIGDTNSTLNFTAHKINNFWLPADYNADSLSQLQYEQNDIASIREVSDSLITFGVASDVVMQWLKKKVNDTLPENNGLVLIPDDASTKIVGFQGLSNSPDFKEPVMRIVVQSTGGTQDTITGQSNGDVHVITGTSSMPLADRIYLQSNFTIRTKFVLDHKVFPADAVINKATLTFFIDTVNTQYGTVLSDSIMVQALSDSVSNKVNTGFRTHYLAKKGNIYFGDISTSLQNWINGKDNQGFVLRLSDEKRSLNKVVLFGPNSSLKPRLIVYYTDKN